MRAWPLVAVVVAAGFAPPALAQAWQVYRDARHGYEIAVPPGFVGQSAADAGEGEVFVGPRMAELRVWGGHLGPGPFSREIARRIAVLAAEGWAVTGKVVTPGWATLTARTGGRMLHLRAISTCGARNYAMFALTFAAAEIAAYTPVLARLDAALQQIACRSDTGQTGRSTSG